jgi:hypothetical protein
VVFGQVDQKIRKLARKDSTTVEALAKARVHAAETMRTSFRLHAGEDPPPSFLISQRQWCNGKCDFDEPSLAAFLIRHAVEAEVPDDEINIVLAAMRMPMLPPALAPNSAAPALDAVAATAPGELAFRVDAPRF